MAVVSVKELLEAGVHFGHECRRWNPKMKRFIFEARNGIHIIDLHQTQKQVEEAYDFIRLTAASGKAVLFVGTKRQAREAIKESAENAEMPYVTERWLGGLMTNIKTIRKSLGRFRELDRIVDEGLIDQLPKKEAASIRREKAKLERNLSGIKNMEQLPGAIFIVDPKKENIAAAEAAKLAIPIVAMVDTNCDPDEVNFPIVCNDDAIRAIRLIAGRLSQACQEGAKMAEKPAPAKNKTRERAPTGKKPSVKEAAGEKPAPTPTPAVEEKAPAGEDKPAPEAPPEASGESPPAAEAGERDSSPAEKTAEVEAAPEKTAEKASE